MPDSLFRSFSNGYWSVWRWMPDGWEGLHVTSAARELDLFIEGYRQAKPDTEVTSGNIRTIQESDVGLRIEKPGAWGEPLVEAGR